MNTLATLTEEEVHQIAYLTMHGWTLLCGTWSKAGKTHQVQKWVGGECYTPVESPDFTREQAFNAEALDPPFHVHLLRRPVVEGERGAAGGQANRDVGDHVVQKPVSARLRP